ncbi:helix-turn-helix domain-containing protein [Streptomyces sp. NBC_00178]|uniref:helix-turn-helix domain-containing protein n=1 Tax=Streptomyces sp. NBC_00178 TaxID=2975672 RepID=UPI002E2D43D5|nr:helix-turn-helix domain-containing protein [Streptomyces sp. NBC_00178]
MERFTPAEAAELEDVRRLDDLFSGHPRVIETIQTVLQNDDSLRQAATALDVHHSTLQERLTLLSAQLGYSPTKGRRRQCAMVASLLWRVAH